MCQKSLKSEKVFRYSTKLLMGAFFSILISVTANLCFAMDMIYPAALKPGDLVSLVSPGMKVTAEEIRFSKERLEALGFKVHIPKTLSDTFGALAGLPEARATEINAAFKNNKIKGIFAIRGGFGAAHILDKLDYEMIQNNPIVWIENYHSLNTWVFLTKSRV